MRTLSWKKALFLPVLTAAILTPHPAAAQTAITHQVSLPSTQTWCSDTMINGLFSQINSFRTQNGVAALTMDPLGMKDAEMRASQFATYMRTVAPGSPTFNPHEGYDTTAASLGYNLVSENLAYITTDPSYIVNGLWQDSLHLAALLDKTANVMGVSCVIDGGTAFWAYEPGICSGGSCGSPTPPTPPTPGSPTPPPSGTPSGTPSLDTEEWAFLSLINNYRAQNGVGPLQVSVALENAAKWMSSDMAAKNYFSHTDSLGRSTGGRLAAFGYSYSPYGENLAAGFSDAQSAFDQLRTACDPDATGACTYAHQKNMLGAGYTAIGISRAYGGGSSYGWYWTTDFGGYVEQTINPPSTTGAAPTINSFTASPSTITPGASATLSWNVTGATGVTIDNGVGAVAAVSTKTLTPASTTTYTLSASNASGTSTAKVTVTVTAAATDTQPPSAPTLTSAVAASATEADLAWSASTDNVGVTGYQVLRNGTVIATVSASTRSYADTGVSSGATYAYSIRAVDAAGNVSPASTSVQVAIPAAPVATSICATPPNNAFVGCYYSNATLAGSPVLTRTDPQINFDWGGNSPDRSVPRGAFSVRWAGNFTFAQGLYTFTALVSDGLRLYVDGNLVMDRWYNQVTAQHTVQQSLAEGAHLITVEYYESTGWSVAHLTWQGGSSPAAPPSILSFAAAPSTISAGQSATLSWNVTGATSISIDNGVGAVTGTTKTVSPAQTTTYTLTAAGAAGSVTANATVTVTAAAAADMQPPTPPTLLTATAQGSTQVNLTWSASADNVAVTGYQVLRNGSSIANVSASTLSYSDTGATAGATQTYSIRAFDAAGNYSAPSNSIQATTAAAPAPAGSCPGTAVFAFTGCYYSNTTLSGAPALIRTDSQINFDWGANPPDRLLARGAFSVRWQGMFNFADGAYTFTATTSDGMRLYVDGKLILDHWNDQSVATYSVDAPLTAGSHVIAVEYYERTGAASAHVSWTKH